MRKFIKFVVNSALVLCVGVPVAFLVFVLGMAALGVTLGIAGAIIGLMFSALKIALMVILPILIVWWVVKRLMAPERTY
jgi:ABC-type Na+ efflux pump permease subunit